MGIAESVKRFIECFFARMNKTTCYLCAEKLSEGQIDNHLKAVHTEC